MHGLSTPCQISHVAKLRRNSTRRKSSQIRRGNITGKPIEKTNTARRAVKYAMQGGQRKIDAILQTAHGEQYKIGASDG